MQVEEKQWGGVKQDKLLQLCMCDCLSWWTKIDVNCGVVGCMHAEFLRLSPFGLRLRHAIFSMGPS